MGVEGFFGQGAAVGWWAERIVTADSPGALGQPASSLFQPVQCCLRLSFFYT